MKTVSALIYLIMVLMVSSSATFAQSEQLGYTDCIQKYRSAWGEDCSQCANYNDSYVVYLKNVCENAIDVMVCVQEDDHAWKRFQHSSVAPGDSLRAYACVGTGKYLAWARQAGDETIIFPSLEQVNSEY